MASALAIGPEEARAALNLAKHCGSDLVGTLRGLVTKYGMFRGPITHGALASSFICLGSKSTGAAECHSDKLVLDDAASALLALRIAADYEDLPASMRKSCGAPELQQLHLRVTGFCYAMKLFQEKVSAAIYNHEAPNLQRTFLKRYLDHELEEELRRASVEFDLERISSFKALLMKSKREVEADQQAHLQALADRVANASLDQVIAHLESDVVEIEKWKSASSLATRAFQAARFEHGRSRYERGLVAVTDKMLESLNLQSIDALSEMGQHYTVMKTGLVKRRKGDPVEWCSHPPWLICFEGNTGSIVILRCVVFCCRSLVTCVYQSCHQVLSGGGGLQPLARRCGDC